MYILRQIGGKLAVGQVASLAAATRFPWRLVDVPSKYKLYVAAGKASCQFGIIAAGASKTLALPEAYTAGKPLYVSIKVNDLTKVVVVSPDHGTSTFLVKATNGAVNGAHDGLLIWVGTVTSITVTAAAAATNGVQVESFLFELPDLTVQTSFRDGARALGVTS